MPIGLAPPPGTPNPLLGRFGVILILSLHHAPLAAITLATGLRAIPASLDRIRAARRRDAADDCAQGRAAALAPARGHGQPARFRRRRRQFRNSGVARVAGEFHHAADIDLSPARQLRPDRDRGSGGVVDVGRRDRRGRRAGDHRARAHRYAARNRSGDDAVLDPRCDAAGGGSGIVGRDRPVLPASVRVVACDGARAGFRRETDALPP